MSSLNAIELTKTLIGFNTINPPGNESDMGLFIAKILSEHGFLVKTIPYMEGRLHVIAEAGIKDDVSPVVFSGHLDTVPLGESRWNYDPFKAIINKDKLYGRGSSDMKAALAAMIVAAVEAREYSYHNGLRLIFTAAEEGGCQGANHLIQAADLGTARGLIIGEPTSNLPATGHKGGIYLKLHATGKTAHSSMPELGINAIYKAARAILKVEKFKFGVDKDPLLGWPTLNVGVVSGGLNLNSVPDHAEFTIDARTTTKVDHSGFLSQIADLLKDEELKIETLVNLHPVKSDENEPFVNLIYKICGISKDSESFPLSLPYLTDGSVLQKYYNNVPTIILGPGEAKMAHKVDEFCYISEIEKSVKIYKEIILNGGK